MSLFTLPVNGPISQSYGKQKDGTFHPGLDFGVPVGTPVRAAADGVISSQGIIGSGGNTVIIQHSSGYETVYADLSSFLLQPGATVKQGQIIGFSGGTKSEISTGPHLHFQIDKGKGASNNVDPSSLLGIIPVTPSTSTPYTNKDSIITQLKKMILGGPVLAVLSANGGNNPVTNATPGSGTVKDVVGGFTSSGKLIGFISNPTNLKRIGVGAIGVTIVVIVSVKLLNDTEVGGKIIGDAKKAATTAAIA